MKAKFEENIFIAIGFICFGIFLMANQANSSVRLTTGGPKIILNFSFIIIGLLILINWAQKRMK
jgi:hypothetical protein